MGNSGWEGDNPTISWHVPGMFKFRVTIIFQQKSLVINDDKNAIFSGFYMLVKPHPGGSMKAMLIA